MKNSKNSKTELTRFEYIGFAGIGFLLVTVLVGCFVR